MQYPNIVQSSHLVKFQTHSHGWSHRRLKQVHVSKNPFIFSSNTEVTFEQRVEAIEEWLQTVEETIEMCNLLWRYKYYLVFFLIWTDIHQTKNYSLVDSLNMIYILRCTEAYLLDLLCAAVLRDLRPSTDRAKHRVTNGDSSSLSTCWGQKKTKIKTQV